MRRARRAFATTLATAIAASAYAGCAAGTPATEVAVRERVEAATEIARDAGLDAEVVEFVGRLAGSVGANYQVTYGVIEHDAASVELTVSRRPPDQRIDVAGRDLDADVLRSEFRIDGEAFRCIRQGSAPWSCEPVDDTGTPLGPFDPVAVAEAGRTLALQADDYTFELSTRSLLGIDATCLTTTLRPGRAPSSTAGDAATLCIAPDGVVLLAETPLARVEAIQYRPDPSEDLFVLPADPP